jgi:hypothetical protein
VIWIRREYRRRKTEYRIQNTEDGIQNTEVESRLIATEQEDSKSKDVLEYSIIDFRNILELIFILFIFNK